MEWLFPVLRPLAIRIYLSLKRYRTVAIVFFAATMASTVLFLLRQPREYAATATVELVWESRPRSLPFEEVSAYSAELYFSFEEYRNTQIEFLRSYRLLERVLDLTGIKEITPEALKGRVLIAPVPDSHLIRITVVDTRPDRAARIANAIADTYMDMRLEERIRWIQRLVEWFQEELRSLRDETLRHEEELLKFQKEHKELTFTGDAMQLMTEIASLNQKYIEAHTKRMEKEGVYRALAAYEKDGKWYELLRAVPDNRSERLLVERTQVAGELAALKVTLGDRHPRVEEMRNKLNALDEELKEIGLDAVRRARMEWEVARSEENYLYGQLRNKVERALEQRTLWNEYQKLRRQVAMGSDLHDALLERWKQVDLTRAFQTDQAILVEAAQVPGMPFRPRVKLTLFLGLFLGSAGALLLVLLLNLLEQSFQNSEDLEALIGIRPIAEVPATSWLLPPTARELFRGGELPLEFKFVYQGLAQKLLYPPQGTPPQLLGITSVFPQEGKSFNALLLSYLIATQFRQRVLLVDADGINPDLSRFFLEREPAPIGDEFEKGRWEALLHSTPLPSLDLLSLGAMEGGVVPIPSPHLWERFFSWARKEYSFILVDTPPYSFQNALYFPFHLLDLLLVVVESQRTSKRDLQRVLAELAGKVGAVQLLLNRVSFPSGSYYGYGYGYTLDGSSTRKNENLPL